MSSPASIDDHINNVIDGTIAGVIATVATWLAALMLSRISGIKFFGSTFGGLRSSPTSRGAVHGLLIFLPSLFLATIFNASAYFPLELGRQNFFRFLTYDPNFNWENFSFNMEYICDGLLIAACSYFFSSLFARLTKKRIRFFVECLSVSTLLFFAAFWGSEKLSELSRDRAPALLSAVAAGLLWTNILLLIFITCRWALLRVSQMEVTQ